MAFTTGNNPFGYHLTSVQIDMTKLVEWKSQPKLVHTGRQQRRPK